jgi:uncharacterized repeat protein (TIGR03803 family)
VYSFQSNGTDGTQPSANLINVSGTLYGTTANGGVANVGTVFKVTTAGAETVLYSFLGSPDGAIPQDRLIPHGANTLYGATYGGGTGTCSGGCGTVFKVTLP